MRKLIVCLAVVGIATALATSVAGAGEGNLKQFCKLTVTLDALEEGPSPKQLDAYRDAAPPEIADTVDQAATQFEEEGEGAFEDESFLTYISEIDQFAVENCDFEAVDVTMADYSFTGIPAEIEKGTTVAFNLTNEGAELHELHIIRLAPNATLDDVLALPADAEEHELEELGTSLPGGGFAFPGMTDVAFVKFKKPGTYVALCFIPVGTTPEAVEESESGGEHEEGEEEAPAEPHYTQGMVAEFEVVAA